VKQRHLLQPYRRGLLAAAAGALGLAPFTILRAQAPREVKVALVAPLSGPWARAGQQMLAGAQMAIDDVNNAGGIKALGGARMVLVTADAGDSVDKARAAIQRLLSQEPDLVGGTGAWLSSFTLALTEVTEREKLPWLTNSYADPITARGYKYVFQTSPKASTFVESSLPRLVELFQAATGRRPKTAAMLGDNTAASQSYAKPLADKLLAANGLQLVQNETFTPPLSDATAMVRKMRSVSPDILVLLTSNVPDTKVVLDKMAEFKLTGKVAVWGGAGSFGSPEMAQVIRREALDGTFFCIANWTLKGQEELARRFVQRTKEPYMSHEPISAYGDIWTLKEAMEQAGSTDRVKVAEALHHINLQSGPAAMAYYGGVRFDDSGLREGSRVLMVQWQNGVPKAVSPAEVAVAKPISMKH
jgi:branched-chain amino acid transport system substrate-binding protein